MTLPPSFPIAMIGNLSAVLIDDSDVTAVIGGYGLWHCECESSDEAYQLRDAIQAAYDGSENS